MSHFRTKPVKSRGLSYNVFMGRFQRSWELTQQSWAVLRTNKALILFPVISSIVALLLTVSFLLPLYLAVGPSRIENPPAFAYVVIFGYYLVSYFIIVFFNAGLIYCANEVLNGRPATLGDGLNASMKRFGPILGWALLAATVGMILNLISARVGLIGQIVVALLGAAWNVVTFFTVPMLVIEGVGPIQAMKGSWAVIRKAWGETLIGNVGIQFALAVLGLTPLVFLLPGLVLGSAPLIIATLGLLLVYWLILGAIGAAMTGIYQVAVFAYAKNGTAPPGFSQDMIQSAFLEKPKSKLAFWKK